MRDARCKEQALFWVSRADMATLPDEKTYVEIPFIEQLKGVGWSHITTTRYGRSFRISMLAKMTSLTSEGNSTIISSITSPTIMISKNRDLN